VLAAATGALAVPNVRLRTRKPNELLRTPNLNQLHARCLLTAHIGTGSPRAKADGSGDSRRPLGSALTIGRSNEPGSMRLTTPLLPSVQRTRLWLCGVRAAVGR